MQRTGDGRRPRLEPGACRGWLSLPGVQRRGRGGSWLAFLNLWGCRRHCGFTSARWRMVKASSRRGLVGRRGLSVQSIRDGGGLANGRMHTHQAVRRDGFLVRFV